LFGILIIVFLVEEEGEEAEEREGETMEHLELLVVNAVEPFRVQYDVVHARASFSPSASSASTGWAGVADLKTFDASWWDGRGGEVVICGRVIIEDSGCGSVGGDEDREGQGKRMIVVEKIELERVVRVFFLPGTERDG
jgi:hypothetical protein